MNPTFNARDAQARQVLTEAGALQKTIYCKTGDEYLAWLKDNELKGVVGMDDAMIEDFISKIMSSDLRSWKQYFSKLISQGGQA